MITFGVSQSLWMVSGSPFMMENSTEEERNVLFSASFGLQTLVGFFGTLVGGYLPTFFANLLSVDVESAAAYAATLGVTVGLSAVALIPVFMIKEQPHAVTLPVRSAWPWHNLSNPRLVGRIFLPNVVISMGAAILIPYMNLFFKETFPISDKVLGTLFAVSSVITGTATLASPVLADRWGRIRSLVFTDVTVERGSIIEDSVLLPEVRVGRDVRIRHAVVDKFCVIPDGFTTGFDRAEDEARFYVTPRGTTLITPEMMGQSMHDYG
jgi:hypothetical protein